jgi:hypothetical protein
MAKLKSKQDQKFRSRIKQFIPDCATATLKPHPNNWRLHPETQKTMLAGMLGKIGKIDAILVYESEKFGGLIIIDGHQRQELDETYPVIVLDVSDDEASQILMTYNPLAELAQSDSDAYRDLLATVEADELQASQELARIAQMVLGEDVVAESEDNAVLKRVDVKSPPKMMWVVVGVPLNQFGSVNNIIEQLGFIDGCIVEMTPSDWKPE